MPTSNMTKSTITLFGGKIAWRSEDWTDSDDRVRGGKSQSYLDCSTDQATFRGTLDITTLGGAGFASQRTTGEDREWDLSGFDGIELTIDSKSSDQKRYTFNLKDELLPRDPDTGRERSTISWEYDFVVPTPKGLSEEENVTIFISWDEFTPTYRGKERQDIEKLDLKSLKRFSIMMRSFFGTQEGDFQLTLKSIIARKGGLDRQPISDNSARSKYIRSVDDGSVSGGSSMKQEFRQPDDRRSIWYWLLGRCGKL